MRHESELLEPIKLKSNPLLIQSLSHPEIMKPGLRRRLGITAGLGAGKTHLMFQRHHYLVTHNRAAPFSGIFYPVYDKIISAGIPTYTKVLHSFGLREHDHYKIVKSPYPKIKYLTDDKHEVHFFSTGVRPDLINAVEYSHGTVDETASNKSLDVLNSIYDRIRDKRSKYLHLTYGGVPVGLNFYADLFDSDAQVEDWNHHSDTFHQHKEKQLYRFKLSVLDAVAQGFVPADYADSLRETYEHDPSLLRALLYGEFTARTENIAAPNYNPAIHYGHDEEADPSLDLNITFDFNISPIAWVTLQRKPYWEYDQRRFRWYALDCSTGYYKTLRDAVLEFGAKYPLSKFRNTRIRIYGDSSGHAGNKQTNRTDYATILETLSQVGYNNVEVVALKSNPREATSIDAVDRAFFENVLYICKRASNMHLSLLKTQTDGRTRELAKPSGEDWTHYFDALKYFIYQVVFYDTGRHKQLNSGFNL